MPAVSVVIPAYNSKSTISECLLRLLAQETDLPYEVIVVESSGDGAAELVARDFPRVKLIASPERLYPGAARNRGAAEASGEILAFIDSDCYAEPLWLAKMWRAHERDCAAVAGSIGNANPELACSISSYLNEFSHFFPAGRPRYVDYLPSGNLSYKSEVFWKYGGFDASEPMYEDLIFNKLLSRAGEKLLFDPDIRVAHAHRTTLAEYLGHEFQRGRANAVTRRRGLLYGASWGSNPLLALLAVPGLYLRKSAVFPVRFLRAYPGSAGRLLYSLPCFYLALLVWHAGFLADVFSRWACRSK
ncbi:MAG: glycosyltransferase [Armatimonadota bacterium]